MNTCTICRTRFEAESPAVLFVSAYGTKRVLCESCEQLLDKATAEETSEEYYEARESLKALANKMKDPEAFETLGAILAGEVDSENAPTEEEEAAMEAVFDEIREEEEAKERELTPEEREKRARAKKRAILIESLIYAVVSVAFIGFMLWFFLR